MYIHIGDNIDVNSRRIIGIFDLEASSVSGITKEFLNYAGKSGNVTSAIDNVPKSFVVACDGRGEDVYLSTVRTQTIIERLKG